MDEDADSQVSKGRKKSKVVKLKNVTLRLDSAWAIIGFVPKVVT